MVEWTRNGGQRKEESPGRLLSLAESRVLGTLEFGSAEVAGCFPGRGWSAGTHKKELQSSKIAPDFHPF